MITYEEEDRSIYSGHYEVQVMIDRPVSLVWPQFLDIPSWVMSHRIETIHGEPGTVGSITRVSFARAKEMNLPPPHHHYCRLLKVVPEQQWLLRTYTGKEGSCGNERMVGFDDGRIAAVGNKTRVTFGLFIEVKSEEIEKDPAAVSLDVSRDGMQKNLDNLKRIVESQ